tara:strand:+ start:1431 stop:1988 length:558 start_codon:yes stop_codon:yes gene_type:complete
MSDFKYKGLENAESLITCSVGHTDFRSAMTGSLDWDINVGYEGPPEVYWTHHTVACTNDENYLFRDNIDFNTHKASVPGRATDISHDHVFWMCIKNTSSNIKDGAAITLGGQTPSATATQNQILIAGGECIVIKTGIKMDGDEIKQMKMLLDDSGSIIKSVGNITNGADSNRITLEVAAIWENTV